MQKSNVQNQLESLEKRKGLDLKEQKLYERYKSGHEGEVYLEQFLSEKLNPGPVKLFDLRFVLESNECQIDCLLIFERECVLIEVKNYAGDYYMKEDGMYMLFSHAKINNPFMQLDRAENMLNGLFKKAHIPLTVRSVIIFTNLNFYLYQDSPKIKAVYRSQLDRFVNGLNALSCQLNNNHQKIIEVLKAKQLETSSYEKRVDCDYEKLPKGMTCRECNGWMEVLGEAGRKNMICKKCKHVESMEDTLMRNVREFNILFSDRKITVSTIYDWTGGNLSHKKIQKILLKHCIVQGSTKGRYYQLKTD